MNEEHKTKARAVFDVWNHGDLERLDDLIAPHVVHHDPYDPHGAEGLAGMKQTITAIRSRFPALHLTVDDQLAEGDQVATRRTARLEPGRTAVGITIDRFEEGKVVEAWRCITPLSP